MNDRPMVNVYEPDADGVEQLVYRAMNDEEFAEYETRQAAAASAPEPEHHILAAVRSMSDEERAALRELLAV